MRSELTIVGATGYTGKLLVKKLLAAEIPFNIAGRNLKRMQTLKDELGFASTTIITDVINANNFDQLLDQSDILVNCVGPFNLLSKTFLQQISRRAITYLDITGEQWFVKQSFDKHTQDPSLTMACMVHSMAFESCLADLMAWQFLDPAIVYDEISSLYSFENSRPSVGTRVSMKTSHAFPNQIYQDDQFRSVDLSLDTRSLVLSETLTKTRAVPVPYPDACFFKRRYRTQNAASYLMLSPTEASVLGSAPALETDQLPGILSRFDDKRGSGPDEIQRHKQRFMIYLYTTDSQEYRGLNISGYDMYGITADLIMESIQLIRAGHPFRPGVHSPAEFLGGSISLDELSKKYDFIIEHNPKIALSERA